ncbi:recombination-associated protein RdgC [Geoalkalibacter halelectricus]|uniref:Recombination-associated protein RdgC n=1 Tax=Geoalkalibacter halelectricus TaxID=2847045 RepID=A0ABY5ZJA9_9BACT|nr:recombination-associated protein RdgC [Geoalkalibacter halelectricus]MDO3379007.1 recombination-associated protein RdgC [Geoalkalibacter halelectricus]UWZ78821.1 recombination-associated protein RdgC [Geoalkalibacter halelectricus]
MGILSNTVSFLHYQVVGELPSGDPGEWAAPLLAKNAFVPIDNSNEEVSTGWVGLDDAQDATFADRRDFFRPPFLTFALRRDQRRVPAALLRRHLERAEEEFLAAHPGLQRVPKDKREELRESVKGMLLARALPVPSLYDAVWDLERGLLTFTGTNSRIAEIFEAQFRQTFDGLRLVALHPFARAQAVVPDELRDALSRENKAGTDAVLEQIQENTWLGADFLRWLLALTVSGRSTFRVRREGPAVAGETFIAFLDQRLQLAAGPQRITVAGPQDHYAEARLAVESGKEIAEATIFLEKGEDAWKTTLKAEQFVFRSFKAPGVKPEKDAITDEKSELEAVFYERMQVLAAGLQLFDSLLAEFLGERLAADWPRRAQELQEMLDLEEKQ